MMLAVFFPSLMGFGILVSGALLISDAVHKRLPRQGRRRRYRMALGAHGIVAHAAHAAGRTIDPPWFLTRAFRSRIIYLAAGVCCGAAAAAVVATGVALYSDVKGVFYLSPWVYGLTVGFSVAFVLVAVLAGILAAVHRRSPAPLRWLVHTTLAGRLEVPAHSDEVHP